MSFDSRDQPAPAEHAGHHATLSNPAVMRALAHPTRLAILQRLQAGGPATASQVAEVVNASPSACSFHLRALAAAGLVEEDPDAPAAGRRRPWRAVPFTMDWRSGSDPGGDRAAAALADAIDADLRARKARTRAADADYAPEWRDTIGTDHLVVNVTAGDLARLRWAIRSLIEAAQRAGCSSRSPGAETVDVVVDYVPAWFPPPRPTAARGRSR